MATKDARRALYLPRPVDAISSLLFGCCARFHSGEPVDAEYLEELCAAAKGKLDGLWRRCDGQSAARVP